MSYKKNPAAIKNPTSYWTILIEFSYLVDEGNAKWCVYVFLFLLRQKQQASVH